MSIVQSDMTFPSNYDCEILSELPGANTLPRLFFPDRQPGAGRDGISIQVTPVGCLPWIGTFSFGMFGPKGISMVLSMPNPDQLCVVSRGWGCVVKAGQPRQWEQIKAEPITAVRVIPHADLVVIANSTELLAFGREGVCWRTERLSWDGLNLIEVTSRCIIGEYWDMRSDTMRPFEVDLESGTSRGGMSDGFDS